MANTATLQTDFDDEAFVEDDSNKQAEPVSVEKDDDGIPYCVKHHCRMRQTSGGKKGSAVAYFACPVDGCNEKAKRIKVTKAIVPTDPHLCPRCHSVSPRPVMERDDKNSNMMYTILKCPCCGHKSSPMPRPEFVHNHKLARKQIPEPDLGAR